MAKALQTGSLLFFLLVGHITQAQVDNYTKNKRANDEEQKRFEQELLTNKDSAQVYWKHANVVAAFTFNAQRSAWKYYKKALSIDSSKVNYFADYGKYLTEMGAINDARKIYERALRLFPRNEALKAGAESINAQISKREEDRKLRSLGIPSPTTPSTKAPDYARATDFQALAQKTTDENSPFYYNKLLSSFNNGNALSDEQTYMLLIGFTKQRSYQPYSDDVKEVYELNAQERFDEAIARAGELVKTNPLLPSLHRELMFSYRKKGNQALAEKHQKKLQSILNAMLYTGDGTCDRPYVAFWVREEYTLLEYLDFRRSGPVEMTTCAGQMADRIEVTHIPSGAKDNVNFNTSVIFKKATSK